MLEAAMAVMTDENEQLDVKNAELENENAELKRQINDLKLGLMV
jgi:cell division protein FtsB